MKSLYLAIFTAFFLSACLGMEGGLPMPQGATEPGGELPDSGSLEDGLSDDGNIFDEGFEAAANSGRPPLGDSPQPAPKAFELDRGDRPDPQGADLIHPIDGGTPPPDDGDGSVYYELNDLPEAEEGLKAAVEEAGEEPVDPEMCSDKLPDGSKFVYPCELEQRFETSSD